jgi:hypothetical protein
VKKLSIIFLSVAFTGGVALACPHEDAKADESAPKTAEKDKAKTDDKAKTKEAEKPKAEEKTPAKDTKTAKPAEKKTDKVSTK